MKLKDALNLSIGDMIVVKKTREALPVVDIIVTPAEHANGMTCVDVKTSDGNWYGYKEVRLPK